MPNWCSTKIEIRHEDELVIQNLRRLIGEWTSHNYADNGFGTSWLGNIVGNSGIGDPLNASISCRGHLSDWYASDNCLTVFTETAWVPMLEMWVRIIDRYAEGATMIYEAEECGEGLYVTNNDDLCGRYIIDSWNEYLDSNYEASAGEVVEFLSNVMGFGLVPNIELEALMSALDNWMSSKDAEFSIYQWELCPIEDYY